MILSYNNVERFIKPIFSHLGIHQLRNLILIVYGIIHCRSLECAEIVRHVPTGTSHHHVKKRIHRFLDNGNVDRGDVQRLQKPLPLVWLQGGNREKTRDADFLLDGLLYHSCIAWISGFQDQQSIPDIQLWQEQRHLVRDRHSKPQKSVGATLFRQIQRRLERNALKTAA